MTVTLSLEPLEEARLVAAAEAKGISAERLVHDAVEKMLAEVPLPVDAGKVDRRHIWEVIADMMRDVPLQEFDDLPRDGASEHDHYLYGSPKRNG